MKLKKISMLIPAALFSVGAHATTIDLAGIGYVQYGDGLSYSMPFAQWQITGDYTPAPGDRFYIESSPGQIADLVVPATGAGGPGSPVVNNPSGMDNAYSTPDGDGGKRTPLNFFQTGGLTFGGNTYPAPDPGQAAPFTGDRADTWDATLDALKGFLAGDQMVFFFNNNQLNKTQAQQSLAAWAQLWITDGAGKTVGNYFEFTNRNSLYALVSEGGGGVPWGDPTSYTSTGRTSPSGNASTNMTDYVLSGGEICANPTTGLLAKCDGDGDGHVDAGLIGPVNHNLGANNAAYAVVFPELNALMDSLFANTALDLTQHTLHVDLRLGCDPTLFGTDPDAEICSGSTTGWGKNINNGYEQVFLGTLARQQIPEPATLALLGLGLAGFGLSRRRSSI